MITAESLVQIATWYKLLKIRSILGRTQILEPLHRAFLRDGEFKPSDYETESDAIRREQTGTLYFLYVHFVSNALLAASFYTEYYQVP